MFWYCDGESLSLASTRPIAASISVIYPNIVASPLVNLDELYRSLYCLSQVYGPWMFWKGRYRNHGLLVDCLSRNSTAAALMSSAEFVWLAEKSGSE